MLIMSRATTSEKLKSEVGPLAGATDTFAENVGNEGLGKVATYSCQVDLAVQDHIWAPRKQASLRRDFVIC